MGIFSSFFKKRAEQNAQAIFQVREYGGEMWLTFCENLVCPCSMLKAEPVEAIKVMRELYIKRYTREDDTTNDERPREDL